MLESILERCLSWLHAHPWGWLLVFGTLLLLFLAWMAKPVTWHDGEGSVVREGQETAHFWDGVLRILWWR